MKYPTIVIALSLVIAMYSIFGMINIFGESGNVLNTNSLSTNFSLPAIFFAFFGLIFLVSLFALIFIKIKSYMRK